MERLTLDDAIKYTKEIARANRVEAENYVPTTGPYYNANLECANQYEQISMWLKELKFYKDAEEQGLLVRLPCKVGDTVWVVTSPINVFDECDGAAEYEVYESFLSSVTYYTCGEQFRINAKVTNSFIVEYFRECDFGKTVFFTREEADSKLEELKNEI